MVFRLPLVFLFALLSILPNYLRANPETESKSHNLVALRMLGHKVLLSLGDSTSRVLPVEQIEDQYKLSFASEFSFQPEDLVGIIDENADQTDLSPNYIVEVYDCNTEALVYSFKKQKDQHKDIVPCKGRPLPESCYYLLFTFLDTEPLDKSPLESEVKTQTTKTMGDEVIYLVLILVIFLFSIGVWLWFKKRGSFKQEKTQSRNIQLGKLSFDPLKSVINVGGQEIELTGKESELLSFLFENLNQTIERDTILARVWGDEGDYIGRTLDVFISRLRKKLEPEEQLKIINVRGVGYKLVLA